MQEAHNAPSEEQEVVDAEVVSEEPSQELVVQPEEQSITLFGTNDPAEVVERASRVATIFKEILRKQGLTQRIGSSDHVQVEGWGTLGSMLGVFAAKDGPVEEIPWPEIVPEKLRDMKAAGMAFGYTASYRAQTLTGNVVGGGEAECKRTESKWMRKDDYALKSMAQTRAQAKALKVPLSFIVTMAGYQPTPAEEMDTVTFSGYEAPFGPPMSPHDNEKLARALTFLIQDAQSAMRVKHTIEEEAGGYMPRIVHRAILHIAVAVRTGLEQKDQPQEEPDGSGGSDQPGDD
jgi:hypothetical protein